MVVTWESVVDAGWNWLYSFTIRSLTSIIIIWLIALFSAHTECISITFSLSLSPPLSLSLCLFVYLSFLVLFAIRKYAAIETKNRACNWDTTMQKKPQHSSTHTYIHWVCSEHFCSRHVGSLWLVRNSTSNHFMLATKYTYFLSSEADRIRFSMSVCVFLLEHSTTQFYGSAIFIIIMIIPTRKRRQLLETALVPTLSLVVMTMLNIPFASWFFFRFMCVFSFFHCTRKKHFISELTSVCSVQRSTDEYSYRRGNLTTSKHLWMKPLT